MSNQKYRVWIKESGIWQDCGEGEMTLKTAERIAKEVKRDCGVMTKVLPAESVI